VRCEGRSCFAIYRRCEQARTRMCLDVSGMAWASLAQLNDPCVDIGLAINQMWNIKCVILNVTKQRFWLEEAIIHGHDRHNTTILSIIHNMSTTCFGQYHFWSSSGWIQLSEKTTQYIIWYSIAISVGVSRGGRDLVYKRFGGSVYRRFIM